jgi:hypothetical protein
MSLSAHTKSKRIVSAQPISGGFKSILAAGGAFLNHFLMLKPQDPTVGQVLSTAFVEASKNTRVSFQLGIHWFDWILQTEFDLSHDKLKPLELGKLMSNTNFTQVVFMLAGIWPAVRRNDETAKTNKEMTDDDEQPASKWILKSAFQSEFLKFTRKRFVKLVNVAFEDDEEMVERACQFAFWDQVLPRTPPNTSK